MENIDIIKLINEVENIEESISKHLWAKIHDLGEWIKQSQENLTQFWEIYILYYEDKSSVPSYNIPMLIGFLCNNGAERELYIQFLDLIWTSLDNSSQNEQIAALDTFRYNVFEVRNVGHDFFSRIFKLLDSENQLIICLAIIGLEKISYGKFTIIPDIIRILRSYPENECIVSCAMSLVGFLSLQALKTKNKLDIIIPVKEIIDNFKSFTNIDYQTHFLDGVCFYIAIFQEFDEKWLDLIEFYNQNNCIKLKSCILRCLYAISLHCDIHEEFYSKLQIFFKQELTNILDDESLPLPPESVIVHPNIIQDVFISIEQFTFKDPQIVESLAALYEKVYDDVILVRSPSSFFLERATQDIRTYFLNLVKYYKNSGNSIKIIQYIEKALRFVENEKQKIELKINLLQHKIVLKITQNDFSGAKRIFSDLNKEFQNFKEQEKCDHSCFSAWRITERLLFLTTDPLENCLRNALLIDSDLEQFGGKIPDNLVEIVNEWRTFTNNKLELEEVSTLEKCNLIYNHTKEILIKINESNINISSKALNTIIGKLSNKEEDNLKKIALIKGTTIINKSLREKGIPTGIHTTDLFEKVAQYLSRLDLSQLFPEKLPYEDKGMNPAICNYLRKKFESVQLHTPLTGRSHIDITIGTEIAIEIKKLESNTAWDELNGQLSEDMRRKSFPCGMRLGIDQTKHGEFLKYNQLYENNLYGPIKFIILEDPYLD